MIGLNAIDPDSRSVAFENGDGIIGRAERTEAMKKSKSADERIAFAPEREEAGAPVPDVDRKPGAGEAAFEGSGSEAWTRRCPASIQVERAGCFVTASAHARAMFVE